MGKNNNREKSPLHLVCCAGCRHNGSITSRRGSIFDSYTTVIEPDQPASQSASAKERKMNNNNRVKINRV